MTAPLFCVSGERLTGYALLEHSKKGSDYASKSEMIRAAGYTRIKKNGEQAIAYTDFYKALIEIKEFNARRELITWANNNPSKSPTIRSIITAIQHQIGYDYRTDCVSRTNANFYRNFEDVDVNIYHQNKLIAAVDYKRKMVVLRISEGSKSDKERLNRILMHFCGLNLFSRNKVWHVSYPLTGHDKAVQGYWTEIPFCASWFD